MKRKTKKDSDWSFILLIVILGVGCVIFSFFEKICFVITFSTFIIVLVLGEAVDDLKEVLSKK